MTWWTLDDLDDEARCAPTDFLEDLLRIDDARSDQVWDDMVWDVPAPEYEPFLGGDDET